MMVEKKVMIHLVLRIHLGLQPMLVLLHLMARGLRRQAEMMVVMMEEEPGHRRTSLSQTARQG